jgi:hypothetical protein
MEYHLFHGEATAVPLNAHPPSMDKLIADVKKVLEDNDPTITVE